MNAALLHVDSRDPCIVYMAGIDVSRDNGAGVNERGFVRSVAGCPDVLCVLPAPAFPDNYRDPRHVYVYGHLGTWWRLVPYGVGLFWNVLRLSRKRRLAGIVVRLGPAALVPLWLSQILKIPLLLKTHSGRNSYAKVPLTKLAFSRDKWHRQMRRVRLMDFLGRPLDRAVIRRSAMIDCPSATCRDAVALDPEMAGKWVEAIANGADMEFYHPIKRGAIREKLGIPADGFVVGYAGAMGGEVRFLDVLIDALIRLGRRQPVYGLLLGRGPSLEGFRQIVRESGMDNRILFPGFIPNREVPAWISEMDLAADMTAVELAAPGGTALASYSQKISQYLACGVPVLAWDIADNRFLRDNDIGFLAPLGDPGRLEQTVETAMAAENKIAARRRCRDYAVASLSYQALAERRMKLWRDCLAKREG